eukprot:6183047-Pleurochrysis_carterae.AAC.3
MNETNVRLQASFVAWSHAGQRVLTEASVHHGCSVRGRGRDPAPILLCGWREWGYTVQQWILVCYCSGRCGADQDQRQRTREAVTRRARCGDDERETAAPPKRR